jgi:DNA modification methylase
VKIHTLAAGRIHEGDWLTADLSPGYTLAIIDGPYAMGQAAWDRMKLDDLAEWYRPHLERVSALLAASASVYLWNTAAGWARIDPVMRGLGWAHRCNIVWDKRTPPSMLGWRNIGTWPDATEVAGFYQRGTPHFRLSECASNVWELSIKALALEQPRLDTKAPHRGSEGDVFEALHPSAKPLAFAERMIRASTRPGERVLIPFGGTNREAVVCKWIARTEPEEARGYDACELNQDGRDYIGPVLAQIRGEDTRARAAAQVGLFVQKR